MREGLGLYARYPLFRTVGIDRSYYRPLLREELAAYAAQLPAGFTAHEKVWDKIVTPTWPNHARYGADAGRANPAFLDAGLFRRVVWEQHEGVFESHLGSFVLEFPPMAPGRGPSPAAFPGLLARFLDGLPKGPRYAVELRNAELLTGDYRRVLADRGVAHVYNWWGRMPELRDQLALCPPTAAFLVVRLLLRPGTTYAERKAAFAPFDRLCDVSEPMRDDVVELARVVQAAGATLDVLVNNKAEGSAPRTVRALAERLVAGAVPR
ncbi:MAG: hypothetical protein RL199_832 [Pseudomonadota bacterium]|jgi:uncharacterized protein YecE (DUF72 family)